MELRLLRYFIAVAEERNFGRAANRLQISQPPLSRAVQQLERQLGVTLLERSASGVTLTPAGGTLYDEARNLLEHAQHVRRRVSHAQASITIGSQPDAARQVRSDLAGAFRSRHPSISIHCREGDYSDPTAGVRSGLADLSLIWSWTPVDDDVCTLPIGSCGVGVMLRADDPLAASSRLHLRDLVGRAWARLPAGTHAVCRTYWAGHSLPQPESAGPVVNTVYETTQSVLWNGTISIATLRQQVLGLAVVPIEEVPPVELVLAWSSKTTNPLVRSFVEFAADNRRYAPQPEPARSSAPAQPEDHPWDRSADQHR